MEEEARIDRSYLDAISDHPGPAGGGGAVERGRCLGLKGMMRSEGKTMEARPSWGGESSERWPLSRGKGWAGFRGAAQPQLGTGIQGRGQKPSCGLGQ